MITRIDPADWNHANTIRVDSDAPDNLAAAREIEAWAHERGFIRTNEYWLRQAITEGNHRVFRAICYRVTADEMLMIEEVNRRVEERMRHLPEVVHAD